MHQYYDTWENEDIPQILASKVFLNIKGEKDREKAIKGKLNGSISKQITAEAFKEIGAFEELETFFKKVKAIFEGTYVEKRF